MNKQVIISIGREYGSGGHVIAEIIAKHYNIPLYDRNILDELSKETGNSYDVYKKYDEKPANPFITRTVLGQSNSVEKIIAEMQFNFLKEKAESGESYVVLGRCAEDILQDNDGLISIFLGRRHRCEAEANHGSQACIRRRGAHKNETPR